MTDFRINVIVDPSQAQAGVRTVERGLGAVEGRAKRLGLILGQAFALAGLGAGVAGAVRLLAGFEQQMSTVQAVSGATADEFEMLREEAQRLGTATRFSATEAAGAMTELSRAGFTATESLAATNDVLVLAQSANLGLSTAASIASNTLRGFRLEVDQTGRVADVLSTAANRTNTSVEGLGDALKFVAPIAAGVGVELEETTAAIGILANAGLDASLAGTGLRRVLAELESPAAKTQKLLRELGIQVDQVRISEVGLTAALKALADAGVDTGTALEIFGDRGGPAFEVLKAAIPDVVLLTAALQESSGSAARVAAIMDDNLNGSLLAVRAALQGVILELGESGATGALRGFLGFLTSGLRGIAANIDTFSRALEGVAAIMATGLSIKVVVGALELLKAALLSNPLTLLPALLLTIVGLVVTFRDEIANLEVAGTRVGDLLAATFGAVRDRVSFLVDGVRELTPRLIEFGADLIDIFRESFEGVLGFAQQFFDALLPGFSELFGEDSGAGKLIKNFANFAIAIFKSIGDVFTALIDAIVSGFANLATFDITSPIDSLKRIARQRFTDLGDIINGTLATTRKNFEQDYVGAFADLGSAAGIALVDGFEGASGAEALARFLDVGGDVNERLARIEAERVARAFFEQFQLTIGSGGLPVFLPRAAGGEAPAESVVPAIPAGILGDEGEDPNVARAGVLRLVNMELNQERKLLALSGQAREVERRALEIENDLRERNVELSADEAKALRERVERIAIDERRAELLDQLRGSEEAFAQSRADLQALFESEAISAERLAIELERLADAQDRYNESAMQLPRTEIGTLAQTLQEFEALGKEALGGLGSAIVEFAATGEDSFEEFTRSLLIEIKKILAEKALIALIDAFSGGAFSGSGLAGKIFGGGRQAGGEVEPGRAFLVGEEGPELFTPRNAGRIVPAGETAAVLGAQAQAAPVVNVTTSPPQISIINSTDPDDIPTGIESDQGSQAVLNVIRRNKRVVRGALGE